MGDMFPTPLTSPPPTLKSNLPMLYYALVIIGTAAVVLAAYNLLVIRWCAGRQPRPLSTRLHRRRRLFGPAPAASRSSKSMNLDLVCGSFKYMKEGGAVESECAVCLSAFEDGEEVRQLPRCKHAFHAVCIDMWLYSHSDCPLCRAPVDLSVPSRHDQAAQQPAQQVNSRDGLPDSESPV